MSARHLTVFAGACLSALSAGAAWAQSPASAAAAEEAQPVQLAQVSRVRDVVVVTATRTEQDIENVPATVSVITAEDIENQLATDIKDLVRFEPGVSVRNSPARFGAALGATGRDGNSGFNIRGLEGNRVLIQTDGIRMPDAFSFGAQSVGRGDYLDLDLIKSVEIVRGPASALYGSDGLAGAVSFTTKDPEDLIRAGQSYGVRGRVAYTDADGSWAESAAAAFVQGAWSAMAVYTHRDAHEQENQGANTSLNSMRTAPNPQDISSDSVLGKIVFAPSDAHRFRLSGEHFESNMVAEVYTGRAPAAPPFSFGTADLDAADETQRDRVSLDYTYENPEDGLIDSGFAAVYYQESQTVQFTAEDRILAADRTRLNTFDNNVWGATGQVESGFVTGSVEHNILVGGDYSSTRQEGLRDGTIPPAGETFPTRAFPNTDYMLAGLFVQDEISFADGRVLLYPALRFDMYDLQPELDPAYPATFPASAQDDSHLSPKFGAVIWATDTIGLFGNYAAGFKAPTPTQVNNGFANPLQNYTSLANPDLKPETSDSFEAGLRFRDISLGGADIAASATAFTAQYRDFIEQVQVSGAFTPADPAVFQFVNLSEVDISGAEARVDAAWANGLGFVVSASYARGDQTTNGVEAPLQSIDPWKLVAGVTYNDPSGRFGGQLIATHSGGKENQRVAENVAGNPAPDLFTPSNFTVIDLTAYWNVTDFLTLRAGAFNIFGETYWWWSDVRGLSAASAVLDAYTQPGRNYSVSVTARF